MGIPDQRIAELAERQHCVFSYRQALAAGLTRDAVRYRLRSRRWKSVHRTVYRVNGAPLTFLGSTMGAVLAGGRAACASHETAAALWALDGCEQPATQHLSLGGGRDADIAGIKVHRPRNLPRADVTRLGVIPVTSPSRTLLDLAQHLPLDVLEIALDSAIRRELVDPSRLFGRVRRAAGPGRRGLPALIELLAERCEGSATESALETRFSRLLREAGLPIPVRQHEIRRRDGVLVARVDFAYPADLVAIELDGYAYHHGRRRFDQDRTRQNRIADAGWLVLRFTDRDVRSRPSEVIRILAGALARRGEFGVRRDSHA